MDETWVRIAWTNFDPTLKKASFNWVLGHSSITIILDYLKTLLAEVIAEP